jgi:hypothetical protein
MKKVKKAMLAVSGLSLLSAGAASNSVFALEGTDKVVSVVSDVSDAILTIGGVVAVLMIVVGGIMYMVSRDNIKRILGAKETLKNAAIGTIIVFGATFFLKVVTTIAKSLNG